MICFVFVFQLKEQVNVNRNLTFDASTNAHDIAGLIKEFLRELPEPLLTRDLCAPFLNVPSSLCLFCNVIVIG